MIVLHGLKNCDTCKKALAWLKAEGKPHRFHDLRADGLTEAMLDHWLSALGWEVLLNKRGTTWRGLPASETEGVDAMRARQLMLAHPALIKRPVIQAGATVIVGFGESEKRAVVGL